MQITVFGCKIYISVLFPALLSLILFFDQSGVMLFGVAAVVLHELGHLIVMLLLHLLPDEIVLQPAGIQIKRNMNTLGSGKRLLIAFAGCGANLLVATGSYFVYSQTLHQLWLLFCACNILLGVFNFLPVFGLDGYDILYILLCNMANAKAADLACKIISALVVLFILTLSIWAFCMKAINPSLLITSVYLLILLLINLRS